MCVSENWPVRKPDRYACIDCGEWFSGDAPFVPPGLLRPPRCFTCSERGRHRCVACGLDLPPGEDRRTLDVAMVHSTFAIGRTCRRCAYRVMTYSPLGLRYAAAFGVTLPEMRMLAKRYRTGVPTDPAAFVKFLKRRAQVIRR